MKKTTFEITIEKLVYGGSGLGHHRGKVVFVPFSLAGDRLLVRPVEEKKGYIRAKIERILQPGNGRVKAVCPYFQKCGGCHWQHIGYPAQVDAKRRMLTEMFHHRFPETREIPISMRACPQPFGYRSRARVQLRGRGSGASVGFFRCGSHAVADVENCPLLTGKLGEALASLRKYAFESSALLPVEEVEMASSEEEAVWVADLPGVPGGAGGLIRKRAGEFTYMTAPSAFFQANDFMVSELVETVCRYAENSGNARAWDLFAGVGLFALPLAKHCTEVIAVENSPEASRLCSMNASAAGFENVRSVSSDVLAWLEPDRQRPDLIVLDPPRTGAGLEIMEAIGTSSADTIIYVSCDPQTLVRDLAAISPSRYRIDLVEGLDMFPQTYHFETVVRLIRI